MTSTDRQMDAGEVLRALRNAQKPGVGVPAYMRWVNRRLARYATVAAYSVGLTPNAVSLISFAVSAAALSVLLLSPAHGVATGVVVAVLLALGFVLDSVDGQLARVTGASGPAGEWLDHLLDSVRSPAVHLCILVVALRADESPGFLAFVAFGFTLTQVGQFASQMLGGMLLDRTGGPRTAPRRHQSWILLPTDTGVMCWIFVLWGLPTVFSSTYAVVFAACLVHALVSIRRRFRELSSVSR